VTKPIEKALTKIPNRFLLTTVVARRWESLVAGAPALVDTRHGDSEIDSVFEEIIESRVRINEAEKRIELEGQPLVEEHDEPLFSEALPTDAKDLKHAVAEEAKD
jgi:DNA-directed RNA polymerase subunit K/omega